MIMIGNQYMGRESGRVVTPKWIWRDHEVEETFVVYVRSSGEKEEIRIKAFKQLYKLLMP
jgi:hypothetical protein